MISVIGPSDMNEINDLGLFLCSNFKNLYTYEILSNDPYKCYKITIDDKIIGFIIVQILQDEVDIIDIIIDYKYQHQGYGFKLLNYVISEYNNYRFILEVASKNSNAISLYKKCNFKVINIRKNYYVNDDAIIMERCD